WLSGEGPLIKSFGRFLPSLANVTPDTAVKSDYSQSQRVDNKSYRGSFRVPTQTVTHEVRTGITMATLDIGIQERTAGGFQGRRKVNDFSIQVATVNGSGSQSANTVLLRSIFQMGVPVSGKNLFPSNIAGLPTWYTIRASKEGYIARKKEIDFLVAMNAETAKEDVMSLISGAA